MQSTEQARFHGLDALRAIALMAGVLLHAALSFLPGEKLWIVQEQQSSESLAVLFYVIHMFRMLSFFWIAGFFARLQMHSLGFQAFAANRLRRIALPLILSWPVLMVGMTMASVAALYFANGLAFPESSVEPSKVSQSWLSFQQLPLMHLWFLCLLLWFYLPCALAWRFLRELGWVNSILDQFDRLSRVAAKGAAPLLFGLPLALVLSTVENWRPWFGIPTPDIGLIPNLSAVIAFGTAFCSGWMFHRQPLLLRQVSALWFAYLSGALILTFACLSQIGLQADPKRMPTHGLLAYALCYSIAAWCWTLALIGLACRCFDESRAWLRYLADASYWIYLSHLPLIILLQGLMCFVPATALLKFMLIVLASSAVLLALYQRLIRYGFIGELLNGARRRPTNESVRHRWLPSFQR